MAKAKHIFKLLKMKKLIYSIIAIIAPSLGMAQLTSPNAESRTTLGSDTVFWFSSPDDMILTATAEESSTFTWRKMDDDSHEFSSTAREPQSVVADTTTTSEEGAYQLTISTDESEATLRAWCLSPQIDEVSFTIDSVTCNGLYVNAEAVASSVSLYDFDNAESVEIAQTLTYEWSMCDSVVLTTNLTTDLELPTPTEDGVLLLTAYNQANASLSAQDSIDSYGVIASYSGTVRERGVENEISSGEYYSAPAEVELTNTSKGDYTVSEWQMGSIARLYDKDPVYSFQPTGSYTIILTVTNENTGCSSTDSTLTITVTDAAMEFPDVFTPNGDGVNDEFRPAYKSLKKYEITIYSRWGRKVYHSTDPSTGWDGKIGGTKAAEGTYFYVAEGQGYDRGVTIKRHGDVSLIR